MSIKIFIVDAIVVPGYLIWEILQNQIVLISMTNEQDGLRNNTNWISAHRSKDRSLYESNGIYFRAVCTRYYIHAGF